MCVNELSIANSGTVTEEDEVSYEGKTIVQSNTTGYVVAIVILSILLTAALLATCYMAYLKKI